jgi:hypothetical protein
MFPCIRFASLWPFDGWNGPTDQHAIAQEAPNFTFSNLDGLLARLRKEIPDRDRRFEAYRSLELAGIVNHARLHAFETRRMLALDAKYDCEIGQFILDRFQSEQLFYTTVHPNRRLFGLLMANIMRSLGISGDIPHLAAFDQMQVPVHPKVAEALEVRWATPERKYRFRQEELTWEQYVRRYIRSLRLAVAASITSNGAAAKSSGMLRRLGPVIQWPARVTVTVYSELRRVTVTFS